MPKILLPLSTLLLLGLLHSGSSAPSNSLLSEPEQPSEENQEYEYKRNLVIRPADNALLEARERRSNGGMGSSFIRFGRSGIASNAVSQPHTRSDVIIRYGRDGGARHLTRLRQERLRKMARIAILCAETTISREELSLGPAEEKIVKEICKDASMNPTIPDFI